MITITLLLLLAAFGITLGSAVKGWPLWIAVLLLCLIHLLQVVPK